MPHTPEDTGPAAPGAMPMVPVWDRFVRLFHWAVVALFVLAFVTHGDAGRVHQFAGYGIAALVALRLVWGFAGPQHARFAAFVRPPGAIVAFLAATLRLRAPRHLGHNPAGGAMVMALIVLLTAITASGALLVWTDLGGVEEIHLAAVVATLGLIGLHLIGVFIASVEHDENLVAGMVTGLKRAEAPAQPTERI